ncbi:MAG: RidA family protein [Rhodospirillales bacterium]
MAQGFSSTGVWAARGRGFSMGMAEPDGVVVHLTGQVAWDADERIVGPGDAGLQTRQAFRNIELLLAEAGGGLADLVAVTTWFLRREDLPAIQAVRAELLGDADPPVSTSVMVAGLGHEDFLVELTPVAVIPHQRFLPPGG